MARFRPKLPDGEFQIEVTCARCQEEVQLTVTKSDIGMTFQTCPACNRYFTVDPDLDTWSPLGLVFALVVVLVFVPALFVDRIILSATNAVSVRLQRWLVTNKYVLALAGFAVGAVSFVVLNPTKGILDTVVWTLVCAPTILWAWKKAWEGGEEEADVLRLEDQVALQKAKSARFFRLLWVPPLGIFFWFGLSDPWALGMLLMSSGFYFVDTEHIPPSRRGVFDRAKQLAFLG